MAFSITAEAEVPIYEPRLEVLEQRIGEKKETIREKIDIARNTFVESAKNISSEASFIGTCIGPMHAGKTTVIGEAVDELRAFYGVKAGDDNFSIGFYKLKDDTRYKTDESKVGTKGMRNGDPIKFDVDGAYSSFEEIMGMGEQAPKVVALSEAAFWDGDFEAFTEWIRETKRILLMDGLGWFFNGAVVPNTVNIAQHSDITFALNSYDAKNGGWAGGTMRYDTWVKNDEIGEWEQYKEGGRIDNDKCELNFNLQEALAKDDGILETWMEVEGHTYDKDGRTFCRVPSHPNDGAINIGSEQYAPATRERMRYEYDELGEAGLPVPDWETDALRFSSILSVQLGNVLLGA